MSLDYFDDGSADAFLAGMIPAANAPPGYHRVVTLIRTARLPVSTGELAAEDQVVAALLAEVRGSAPQVKRRRTRTIASILTVKESVLAAVLLEGALQWRPQVACQARFSR